MNFSSAIVENFRKVTCFNGGWNHKAIILHVKESLIISFDVVVMTEDHLVQVLIPEVFHEKLLNMHAAVIEVVLLAHVE